MHSCKLHIFAEGMSTLADTIVLIAVLLLSLYGCVELIRWLALRILRPPKEYSGVLVLPISGHCPDVEYLVRTAASQSRWAVNMTDRIFLLDAGMDEETRALAEDICAKCEYVEIGSTKEIEKMFYT